MPGLSLFADVGRGVGDSRSDAHRALDAVCHREGDRSRVLVEQPWALLGLTSAIHYPFASFDDGDVAIHLEGRIYAPDRRERSLRRLAEISFDAENANRRLAAWVEEVDGEFVAVAVQRSTRHLVLVNDQLGRLPLYAALSADRCLVSRELRFLTSLLPRIRFDAIGIAQHLAFRFPLGRRTLLADVERLPPATILRVDGRARQITAASAPPRSLEQDDDGLDLRQKAEQLVHLFTAATRGRAADGDRNVVSLSGGGDSRSVAAALHRERLPFRCVSFLDADGGAAADVAVAERLAALFGAEWRLYRLAPPSTDDEALLLRLRSGFNPLSMASLVAYLERVQADFGGDVVFFTGDSGDRIVPGLRDENAGDADGVIAALMRTRCLLSLEEIGALTGVGPGEFIAALREQLEAYPEREWADRQVHFEVLDRAYKWLYEGEDRNRAFFWSTTPFWAAPFFGAVMRARRDHKAHRRLYDEFLRALSPAAAALEYAGIGAPMDSKAFRVATKAASLLARLSVERHVAALALRPRPAIASQRSIDHLRAQQRRCPAIGEYLDPAAVDAFLGTAAERPIALDELRTVASAIELLAR